MMDVFSQKREWQFHYICVPTDVIIMSSEMYVGESKSIRTGGLILCGLAILLSACAC
jgi:hypothetical protein